MGAGAAAGLLLAAVVTALPAQAAPASDGPGAVSHFDLARKDCLGTAQNSKSKVWYTVADGVLSDVYYPTIDTTNVETLQYVVTDGSSFTDLQTRDMTYKVEALDSGGMACRVTTTAKSGRYRIVTDYITDPGRATVLTRVSFVPLVGSTSDYHLYVRFDPTVNGNGGGGGGNGGGDTGAVDTSTGSPVPVASDTVTATNAANRDYAQPVYAALQASTPFLQVTNGYAGQPSDGLVQLDASHALTQSNDSAAPGNLVQTAEVTLPANGAFELALGFGADQASAVKASAKSLRTPFDTLLSSYVATWTAYDDGLNRPDFQAMGATRKEAAKLRSTYLLSANVLKASEDKTFKGAIVAGLGSPWGQAVSAGDPANTYFGSYREVFSRDLYEAYTGLLTDGDLETAKDATLFLFNRQQLPDGSMPRNSLVNGKTAPDSFNTQLDEVAYPILMAHQLGLTSRNLYVNHIKRAANYVAAHGPATGPERWEEQDGFSPSTIAAEIAGLLAGADIAELNGDAVSAAVWRGVADDWQRSIKGWAVTTNGPLADHPYFIRLSKTGDPNAAISYNVGNGGPTLDQREVIDAGFLELSRLGELPADDPDILASLPVVDDTISTVTPCGRGWHRYNGDGYGDGAADGHPWAPSNKGTGHLWPVLSAERGAHDLQLGDDGEALDLLVSMSCFASGVGLIPEQDWELPDLPASPWGTDPTVASIGFVNGGPAGSTAPLTWSAGAFVRLANDLDQDRLIEQPQNTVDRYINATQGATTLTLTGPPDQSAITGSPVIVTGNSVPGAKIAVAGTNVDAFGTRTAQGTAGADGSFRVKLPVVAGTTIITVVATAPDGGTATAKRTVVWDVVPGTVLLDVADPDGDDNGPGNYAYPTSDNFKPGAYDLERFQVIDAGDDIVFRVQTRDLTPTFGSPLGAQLVDVYVHDPAATTTSTDASFTSRNYAIAPGSAWSRLIEVQGFGQRYVDATGATLGTVAISANAVSRFITFRVSKASLGTPTSGWGFTVVLTGQDGFSPDQARGFQTVPQDFQFGVCATASTDPHCTVDPNTVPKAVDVITPDGVSQSTELDYLLGPVVLQDVTIP
jgi:glucan 1,4-alpha-glucosidase